MTPSALEGPALAMRAAANELASINDRARLLREQIAKLVAEREEVLKRAGAAEGALADAKQRLFAVATEGTRLDTTFMDERWVKVPR